MRKLASLGFISLSLFANTNDVQSLDDLSLEELMNIKIYSATKDYRSIQDIPANITILTRKDIEKYHYTTLGELLKNIPGLFIFDDTEHFQIGSRGSLGSSFKLMMNDNPIFMQRVPYEATSNRNFFSIPIESIDRIEIIKGPQAVTYGANSMYGSINVITNDFNEKNNIFVGKGNNGQDKVYARINHSHENGGFTLNTSFYNTNGLEGNLKETLKPEVYNAFPTATKNINGFAKNEYKNLDFSNRYKNLTTDVFYSQTNYGVFFVPSYREGTEVEQKEQAISITYDDEIGNNIDYKINYINARKTYDIDKFNVEENPLFPSFNYDKLNKNQVDAHINYTLNEKIKFLIGTTYEKIDKNLISSASNYPQKYSFDTKDVYTKIHYKASEKAEFNIGTRYTKRDDFISYLNNGVQDLENGEKKENYLPEFSAIYHINYQNHIKFLYGKANQLSYQKINDFEDIESKEINYLYMTQKYNLSTSLFLNKTNNLSLFSQNLENASPQSVKGSQESKGLEIALTYMPTRDFQTSASFTYQKSTNLVDKSLEPSFSPDFLGKISATYLQNDTRYSLWVNYISPMKANRDEQTGELYGVDSKQNITLNTNISHKLSQNSSLNLHILNILDRDNRMPAGGNLTDFYNGVFTTGRTFFVGYDYKF